MAQPHSFEPRSLLIDPDAFGHDPDAVWRLAVNEKTAIRLQRAREQHELARVINDTLQAGRFSIPDLAERLGYRRENLWRKLTGEARAISSGGRG